MTRYRPPTAKSSPYITSTGFTKLQQELKGLWARRDEVVKALAAAAAEGDRSENAEYIYRKKELREIDRRIRYLQKRIPELKVITHIPEEKNKIFFSAWVKLEDMQGNTFSYRIVGPDETDIDQGHISVDSPLAKALLKKTIDDEICVTTPNGEAHYIVTAIRYEPEEVN